MPLFRVVNIVLPLKLVYAEIFPSINQTEKIQLILRTWVLQKTDNCLNTNSYANNNQRCKVTIPDCTAVMVTYSATTGCKTSQHSGVKSIFIHNGVETWSAKPCSTVDDGRSPWRVTRQEVKDNQRTLYRVWSNYALFSTLLFLSCWTFKASSHRNWNQL